MSTPSKPKLITAAIILLLVGLIGGWLLGHLLSTDAPMAPAATTIATTWTCSMHPQIQQPEPGDCPICGMDLIPVASESTSTSDRTLALSPAAQRLAGVEVTPVTRRQVTREVRMVGTIVVDETRQASITAWVGGRLDRLYVDYTGITVKAGDHMVWMYSPSILIAQEELIQAQNAFKAMTNPNLPKVREAAVATRDATRDKLRLWGLTDPQVKAIEKRGTASDHIQINAPIGGVVTHKNALEGAYVEVGTPIYQIADLSQVWVMLDAYETDLAWLRYGQEVTFETESYPGETFTGRIAFIDPMLTTRTRTVKVRLNVDNTAGRLKPGMFVRASAKARLAGGGKVIDPDLAGKWICPMHPDVIDNEATDCRICGMPLETAESLGYDQLPASNQLPLVIPATAPLITGKRAVVYIQQPGDQGTYEGVTVSLGPLAGDVYIVESGLSEGQLVVSHGAFKIDSALQIQAKPSMMNPPPAVANEAPAEEPASPLTVPAAFHAQLKPLFTSYFAIQTALAADDLTAANSAADACKAALTSIDMSLLSGDTHDLWMELSGDLHKAAGKLATTKDIGLARGRFERLSVAMITVGKRLGTGYPHPLPIIHCPMAFDNLGADWIQVDTDVRNPYFGASMLGCGGQDGAIPASGGTP